MIKYRLASVFKLFFLLLLPFGSQAQKEEPIRLLNPSFEDIPRHSVPPRGWSDCGFSEESPPDVQPSGFWRVSKVAQEGNTYLGLVVRDNDTWEAVGQRLNRPIEKDHCYSFSIYACRSEFYVSQTRATKKDVNFTQPARIRVWGGAGFCNKRELLGETSTVANTQWQEYKLEFHPKMQHTYITIEAFYQTPTLFPYNGNILLDNASAIVSIDCPDKLVASSEKKTEKKPEPKPAKKNTNTPTDSNKIVGAQPKQENKIDNKVSTTTEPPKTKLGNELDRKKLKLGQTIRLDELHFEADSARITQESYPALEEIYAFLSSNHDVIVEVGGHTNNIPPDDFCDRLSSDRAKAIAEYLVEKGIPASRIKYKGYGKKKPIASNATPQGRKKNQRVEIKILSLEG